MPVPVPAHPFRKRLPRFQTAESWTKLARNPSYLAPRAEDVQSPTPFEPPQAPVISNKTHRLLDAILARPDDDAPRLAYAQHSPDDGEFIRVQLAIAREMRAGNVPPVELFDREAKCLPGQIAKWSERLAPWGATDLVFRRGFIERLSLTGRSFLSLGSTLFDFLPLHGVRLVAVKWYLEELAKCSHWQRLASLDLSGNRIGTTGLETLCPSPDGNVIRQFDLSGNNLNDDDVLTISRFDLQTLRLAENRLTSFDGSRFPRLERLTLSGNRLESIPTIPPAVRRLELSECGLKSLPALPKTLTELDLSFNPDGVGVSEGFERLTVLSLRGNRLKHVSQLPTALPCIRSLDLGANLFGDAIVNWLTTTPMDSLTSLDLTNTLITRRGLFQLIDSGRLTTLHSLNLSWNDLGDEGIIALANCPEIGQLRKLDVTGAGFGRRGANALTRSPDLRNGIVLRADSSVNPLR